MRETEPRMTEPKVPQDGARDLEEYKEEAKIEEGLGEAGEGMVSPQDQSLNPK